MVEFMYKIRGVGSNDNCKSVAKSLKKYFGHTLKNEQGNFYEHADTTNIFTHSDVNKLAHKIEEAYPGMIESSTYSPTLTNLIVPIMSNAKIIICTNLMHTIIKRV